MSYRMVLEFSEVKKGAIKEGGMTSTFVKFIETLDNFEEKVKKSIEYAISRPVRFPLCNEIKAMAFETNVDSDPVKSIDLTLDFADDRRYYTVLGESMNFFHTIGSEDCVELSLRLSMLNTDLIGTFKYDDHFLMVSKDGVTYDDRLIAYFKDNGIVSSQCEEDLVMSLYTPDEYNKLIQDGVAYFVQMVQYGHTFVVPAIHEETAPEVYIGNPRRGKSEWEVIDFRNMKLL